MRDAQLAWESLADFWQEQFTKYLFLNLLTAALFNTSIHNKMFYIKSLWCTLRNIFLSIIELNVWIIMSWKLNLYCPATALLTNLLMFFRSLRDFLDHLARKYQLVWYSYSCFYFIADKSTIRCVCCRLHSIFSNHIAYM